MVRQLQTPAPGSKPLRFKNHYSTGLLSQVGFRIEGSPGHLRGSFQGHTPGHCPNIPSMHPRF